MNQKELPDNEKDAVLECLIRIHGHLRVAIDWCALRAAMQLSEEGQEETVEYWKGLEVHGQHILDRALGEQDGNADGATI